MRILFALLVCVVPLMSFGQGLKLTSMTTNLTMNQPINAGVPVWNDTAKRWSNAVVTATATNAIANNYGLGTNTSHHGSVTNNGTLRQVGAATILDDMTGVTGKFWTTPNLVLLSGNVIEFPADTAPSTTARQLAVDSDFQGGGRGALQFDDGLSDTILVGTLKSDTPSNGQVPKWNTGGTITWEDDTGGSGSPGGAEAMLQVNMGGAFVGSTNITANVTNGTLMIGTTTAKTNLTVHNSASAAGISVSSDQGLGNTNQFDTAGIRSSSGGLAFDLWNSINAYNMSTNDFSPGFTVKQRLGLTTKYWYEAYIAQLFSTNVLACGSAHVLGGITGATLTSSNVLGAPSFTRWYETNGTLSHVVQAASQISRHSTNIVGVLEVNTNAVIALDLRQQQELNFTNRMTHNTTIWLSNGIPYDKYVFNFLGAVGGGTDYTVTLNAMNSYLICDMTGTNNAVATNLVISVPAGSGVEVNGRITFGGGTNRHGVFYAKGLH